MMTGLYGYTCYGPPHGEDRAQWQALENLAVTTDPSEEETEELGVLGAGATIQARAGHESTAGGCQAGLGKLLYHLTWGTARQQRFDRICDLQSLY